ncbi:hypothetical protein Csa_016190 [Cucumis sativus]|uniref:Uncharacterized protein n=1 Tax=Cucumis sativus TaxID=3659 RepID=A0A0A0K5E7_CUCSA|nr:hypothetical protein Csa_016190 [Cucumis sativus]
MLGTYRVSPLEIYNQVWIREKHKEAGNKLAKELEKLDSSINYGSKKASSKEGRLSSLSVMNCFLECKGVRCQMLRQEISDILILMETRRSSFC